MRWLPFLLVILSAVAPVERLADSLEVELAVRSIWSILLVCACYKLTSGWRPFIILSCEFLSVAYNLAIALGYYFAETYLGAWYAATMFILFCIELGATFPGVRFERRQDRNNRRRYRSRSFIGPSRAIDSTRTADCQISEGGLCRL